MKFLLLVALIIPLGAFGAFLSEPFSDDGWSNRWRQSTQKSDFGEFKVTAGKFFADAEASKGLQTSQDARHYAISTKFSSFSNEGKPLVVQMEVKHEQSIDCGGGYIKLLASDTDQSKFTGDSPYFIMFGPDICGATKKVHLIFHHKGKNLLWKKEPRCESDQFTHLYTMILNPDGSYEVRIDGTKKESGTLEADWDFLPPKEIDDPSDHKPSDWVDEAEMDDPDDKKPADWDQETETIVDPAAKQPDDWDEEEDGKWEAPTIPNPKFKGEWKAKRIANPKWKGIWKAKQIPNPAYQPDSALGQYKDIGVAGFDLWQVKSGTIFDNILITDSIAEADAAAKEFQTNKGKEKKMKDQQDEEERKRAEAAKPADEPEETDPDEEDEPAEGADHQAEDADHHDEL